MKQPALHMRLLAAILLTALCLSACGGGTSPKDTSMSATDMPATIGSETTPACHTAPTAPSETTDTTGQTEPAEPSDAPEYTADAAGKIASVSVGTPEEWNRFARDFNAERDRFAESIDVFVETQISFAGTAFVALKGSFSGRIHGPERGKEQWENVFVENGQEIISGIALNMNGWYGGYVSEFHAGFCDIDTVEGGISLFGGANGDVTIENLDFADISYTSNDSNGDYDGWSARGLLCIEAETLTLDTVTFSSCEFRQRYTRKNYLIEGEVEGEGTPCHLLASGAETLRLHRVFAANCDLLTSAGSGGLLFHSVTGDASFSELYLLGCSVTEITGDFGYLSLLGYSVGGKADFEDITMFDCRTYGRLPSAFGRAGSVGKLRNVTVESCVFTVPQGSITFSGSGSLLFFTNGEWYDYPDEVWYDLEGKTLEGVTPENVVFENCMATLYQKDFDWYRDRGITVENCLNVTTGPAKREYQMRTYGEVYD